MADNRNTRHPLRPTLHLSTPIVLLAVGVLGPVVLTAAAGIVAVALWENPKELVLGLLSVTLGLAALATAIVVTVLLGKRSRLARMQADLLANVSHELKTPLAGIRLHAQTLLQPEAASNPEILSQCVSTIVRETEWLSNTVDTLLTWRGAASDRNALSLAPGSMADACNAAAERFARMLPPGEARFEVQIQSSATVAMEPKAIHSIIINLLTNAYKYTMPPRTICLSVWDQPGEVLVSVQDNGIGISRADQARIFEPFYRVDNRLRAKAAGAGLGLAIVAHLARLHGASVRVQSEVGEGATFELRFPSLPAGPTETHERV